LATASRTRHLVECRKWLALRWTCKRLRRIHCDGQATHLQSRNAQIREHDFVIITCPDLQSVCALVAQDKLTEHAYTSPAGPIAPLDILYSHRPPMAKAELSQLVAAYFPG